MTYQELYDLAGRWNKTGRIPKNSKKEIVVYDVADQTASAKLTAMWGVDYLHLAKFEVAGFETLTELGRMFARKTLHADTSFDDH
jgi:hypothetical protein